jgi:hypothetical protein
MGKSHRNVCANSISESWHADKERGFAKNKKAYSHHQIRNENKNCDEDSIQTTHFKKDMQMNCFLGRCGKIGNIPNAPYKTVENVLYIPPHYGSRIDKSERKWYKDDASLLESIDRAIMNGDDTHERNKSSYLVATKKQIERRGEVGAFRGHRN